MKAKECSWRRIFRCACGVVVSCTLAACAGLPPDPDNGALLYYQAALVCPEADLATHTVLNGVLHGTEPGEMVRQYVDKCRQTIRLTEAATERANCTWGMLYSQGDSLQILLGDLRQLLLVLEVDARIQVADGNAVAAFDKALRMRRFARHISNETVMAYGTSLQFNYRALLCIQHVLGSLRPDIQTLTWLQAQLAGVQGAPQSPANQLAMTLDYSLRSSQVDHEFIARWRESAVAMVQSADAKTSIRALTDGQVLERAKQSGDRFSASVQRVIGSAKPYAEKYIELQQLVDGLDAQIENGDPVGLLFLFRYSPDDLVVKQYDVYVRGVAQYNAVGAAIEIYAEKARAGHLPQAYPQHLPGDPFSGEDFEYQLTDEGFVLRCQAKEIGENRIWEYAFKARD